MKRILAILLVMMIS